jgi:hypothetical protein
VPPPRDSRFGSPLVLSRVHWVRPELAAEVKYLTWTEDNPRARLPGQSGLGPADRRRLPAVGHYFTFGCTTARSCEPGAVRLLPIRPPEPYPTRSASMPPAPRSGDAFAPFLLI